MLTNVSVRQQVFHPHLGFQERTKNENEVRKLHLWLWPSHHSASCVQWKASKSNLDPDPDPGQVKRSVPWMGWHSADSRVGRTLSRWRLGSAELPWSWTWSDRILHLRKTKKKHNNPNPVDGLLQQICCVHFRKNKCKHFYLKLMIFFSY